MSCEGIDLFQTYYKYKDRNVAKTCHTKLSNFRHVDFQHKLQDELVLFELHAEFTTYKELREQIDNLVDFLNLYGHKIKLTFVIRNNLSNTVVRVNEILSKTTSNLLYVSIVIEAVDLVCNKLKFPLHMKLLHIHTYWYKNIYSKLFIDTDAEEYPCLIFNNPIGLMLPEKYIDYTKITSLITKSFISPKNNVDCCVNLRNLCIDTQNDYCTTRVSEDLKRDCFEPYSVFKKMKCLMLRHMSDCECDIRQIDHIPYYYVLTDIHDYNVKFKRNRIIKKNNTIFVPYEIECRTCWISPYAKSQNVATLRHNRFPHVLRLSKVLPKTIFYSILKLFLQYN